MKTFQDMYTDAQTGAHDRTAETLVFLKAQLNEGLHIVEDALGSFYTEKTRIIDTDAGEDEYAMPDNYVRMKKIYTVVDGERKPVMVEIRDEEVWQRIKMGNSSSSYPTHVFYREDTFEVSPTPDTDGNDMVLRYEARSVDMSYDDYSTGTILTLANGGLTVTGQNSPAWDDSYIGRFFKIDAYPQWYEIADVPTTTTLTLKKPYQGIAITGGNEAYTIGEIPHIPESIHSLPVYYALWKFYLLRKVDKEKAAEYKDMFYGNGLYEESGLKGAKARWGRRSSSKVIPGQRRLRRRGSLISPNYPPPAIP